MCQKMQTECANWIDPDQIAPSGMQLSFLYLCAKCNLYMYQVYMYQV